MDLEIDVTSQRRYNNSLSLARVCCHEQPHDPFRTNLRLDHQPDYLSTLHHCSYARPPRTDMCAGHPDVAVICKLGRAASTGIVRGR